VPIYVNRRTRVRHVDPACPALRQSKQLLDAWYEDEPERRPTGRIVELPDPTEHAEIEAMRDFTYPCIRCVPGARDSWASFPIDFEDSYEYEVDDEGSN
jgi:hypothetical protein